ncbi:MAG: DUF2946 domain-containing protein [Zoogloeaceae bacterium]|nr:DUF2946 domain-containing protein [Zoogloeaceae bacterium]
MRFERIESAPMRFHQLRSSRFIVLALLLLAFRLAGGVGAGFMASGAPLQGNGKTIAICTTMGVSMLEVETDTPSEPSHHTMGGAHCPFCLAGHDALALPCADFSFPLPEPAVAAFLPPSSAGFQPPVPDARHAPPRAPPSFA